ncbi:uncharacterized protein RSE6_02630 [Rhynchosporium secalis]|uniref:Uncharacterized protein n=1 Tax=Rhynchosporium secalis TaxID=38038 RepID=A0A1E1M0P5_RHYSE|nr:uncharacterized protein RSE6_02630 [Rhynchosporium secalis]
MTLAQKILCVFNLSKKGSATFATAQRFPVPPHKVWALVSPFSFIRANDAVEWRPEPTTRGTFGILSNCLITTSLYIWTALHLHVPGESEKYHRQLLRKLKWLIIGLLAPEYVLFNAWYQYVQAKQTARRMLEELSTRVDRNGLQSETSAKNVKGHVNVQDPEQGSRELTGLKKFTVKQGFFIGMGGLAFDTTVAKGVSIPRVADDFLGC